MEERMVDLVKMLNASKNKVESSPLRQGKEVASTQDLRRSSHFCINQRSKYKPKISQV